MSPKKVWEQLAALDEPKLRDWFVVNVVKLGRHAEELRVAWKSDENLVGRAGWSLTTDRVIEKPDGREIGIHHASRRKRAIAIGERLKVHVDYPASPGCTPPYVPLWIAETVRRRGEKR